MDDEYGFRGYVPTTPSITNSTDNNINGSPCLTSLKSPDTTCRPNMGIMGQVIFEIIGQIQF